jgi:hypothetical protein
VEDRLEWAAYLVFEEPSVGSGFTYLVGARNALGRGPLGFASDGSPREVAAWCP